MQVAGVYLPDPVHWSDVVCEYDVEQHMLCKIQARDVAAGRHLMSPGAEYMVFELQPPADVSSLEQRAVHLPCRVTCALVCAPCVILRVSLEPLTSADLQATCAAEVGSQGVQRRYHLQLQSVASSVQWMAQPKQPKEWGEKKGSTRKMSTTPKKRRARAAEVLEEDDDVLDEVVEDVDERDGDEDSDDVDDVDVECEGEEDDEAEADDAGDEGGDELELEDDEDEEDEEEVDDAVSANSSEEEVNEAEDARSKGEVKKARRS